MTAAEVIDGLERVHPDAQGEWLLLREALGIDALAIHCWRGRGKVPHERVAYEVKVSRSDVRREIARPYKRAGAMAIADRFYFACPELLILAQEVPAGCGLVWVGPRRTRTIVKAPPLESRGLTRHETARLLRSHLNPPRLQAAKMRAARADDIERGARVVRDKALAEARRAHEALAFYGGHLVAEGQVWVGRFPSRRHWTVTGYAEPREDVRVLVEKFESYPDGSAGVTVGAEGDDRTRPTFQRMVERVSVGAFLSLYRPAEPDRVVPVAAA